MPFHGTVSTSDPWSPFMGKEAAKMEIATADVPVA
jgi:hypothetical protein